MDFSCDRCGRRYFVPDDLVPGRVFRAKCDDCNHAFDVVATDTAAAAAVPAAAPRGVAAASGSPAALPPDESEYELIELEELLELDELEALEEILEPGSQDEIVELEEMVEPDAMRDDTREHDLILEPPPPLAPTEVLPAPQPRPPRPARPDALAAARAPPQESAGALPRKALGAVGRNRPARRDVEEARGDTEEIAIAAGTKHRFRSAGLALAGAAAACVAVGVLVTRAARGPPEPARARSASAAPGRSGSAPLDASSLAARPRTAATVPSAKAGGAGSRPRRRIVAGRIEDRKLLDLLGRKDDVAMAAPAEDVALDSANGALDPAAVERTVGASRRAFDACITRVLRLHPGFRVPGKRATIVVTVQPTGKVTGAWIGEEQVEGTELGQCLVAAASRMAFPTFDGDAIDVSIPLSLSAIR